MSFEIGLRGVNAAMRGVDRAAFEIARSASQQSGQPSPADATAPAAGQAAGAAAMPPARAPVAPEVDLPGAMVDLIASSRAVMANLQTIRRTDEALESLLKRR